MTSIRSEFYVYDLVRSPSVIKSYAFVAVVLARHATGASTQITPAKVTNAFDHIRS